MPDPPAAVTDAPGGEQRVDLSMTSNRGYHPGRPFAIRALWLLVEAMILLNPAVTSYGLKRFVLRLFGARVGKRLIIKPDVHVKYPWRLRLGDDVWLGERCWIDNMADVSIGNSVCISQGAYLCTGNHDWSDPGMGLVVRPIVVSGGAWIAARAVVGPGVNVGTEAVVSLGCVLTTDAEPRGVYAGNPASLVKTRRVGE